MRKLLFSQNHQTRLTNFDMTYGLHLSVKLKLKIFQCHFDWFTWLSGFLVKHLDLNINSISNYDIYVFYILFPRIKKYCVAVHNRLTNCAEWENFTKKTACLSKPKKDSGLQNCCPLPNTQKLLLYSKTILH